MSEKMASSRFQEVIETVEALPDGDQALLVEIIRQRLIQQRRAELAADIAEARNAYQRGEVQRGTEGKRNFDGIGVVAEGDAWC